MKIVQVVFSLHMGGQERLVVRLANAYRRLGHDSHVVSLSQGGVLRRELHGDVTVHDVPQGTGFNATLYLSLASLFRRLRPDVVHTHNASPLIYAAPSARASGVPTVVHTKHGDASYSRAALGLLRAASKTVDTFVSVSEDTHRAACQRESPAPSRSRIIQNGIPTKELELDEGVRLDVRRELGIPLDARVVGSVGRLVDEKDFPLLVRAMAPLVSTRAPVHLILVGEGMARPAIEAAITTAIAPEYRHRVLLTGLRTDVPRVLQAFDVFASSSRTEGLPLALAEAMASGLPVVATAVGGVPAVVPRAAGTLVSHGDATALRGALESYLEDVDLRRAAGRFARSYARERFSEEQMVASYLDTYREAEESPPPLSKRLLRAVSGLRDTAPRLGMLAEKR